MNKKYLLLYFISVLTISLLAFQSKRSNTEDQMLTYIVNPQKQHIKLYWKDENGQNLRSIQNLKNYVERQKQTLVFAMNAGMYMENRTPLGLYIENGKVLRRINNASAKGNFYLKPNGVFYITNDNKAFVCKTPDFKNNGNIKYATQSGPMLVIDGKIHPSFTKNASNVHIRNGVGILPDNRVVFVQSKKPVNLYDFAAYFQNLGCKNALYLDGFVSRTYLPEKNWKQMDGNFGVMIGITK